MSSSRVKSDLLLATSADVSRKLLGYVVLAMLARYLSKSDMGDLFFAITFASIFAMLSGLGTHRYLVRKIAQDEGRALDYLSEVLSLRVPAVAISFVFLSVVALLFFRDRLFVLLMAGAFVSIADLYYSFGATFLGLRRLGYRFVTGLIDSVLLVVLVAFAMGMGWSLREVLWCYLVANVALVVVTGLVVRAHFGPFGAVLDPGRLRPVATEAFPFFVLMILGLLFLKIDTVMLRFIKSTEAVAEYEAAFKFLEVSRFAVRPVAMVFFPVCSQLAVQRDWTSFLAVFKKLWVGAVCVGGVIAAGVIAAGPILIPFVWGLTYETSIPILRVLFLAVPFLFLSFVGTFLAQALHLERTVVRIMMLAVGGNILLNALVIPRWGALGAAWTTVAGEGILAGCLIWLVAWAAHRAARERSESPRENGR